jgi:hypothetical protein
MGFKPKPPAVEKTVDITVSLPAAHHERLVAVGEKHNLPTEEVLKQFIAWAIDTGAISSRSRKASKKAPAKA